MYPLNPNAVGGAVPVFGSRRGIVEPGINIGDVLYWNGTLWVPLAPGADGRQLTTHGVGLAPSWEPAGGGGGGILGWGANSVAASTTTRYLYPWFSDNLAETGPIQWRAPRAFTARNMRVRHNTTAGNGNAIVYTLRVNSVATALAVSLASTASDGQDLIDAIAVAAGDLVDIQVTKAAAIGSSPTNITLAMESA